MNGEEEVRDDLNDVLAVMVDGTVFRPDGHVYHITLAVNRAAGGRPARSNELVRAAIAEGGVQALHTLTTPFPVSGCVLEAVEGMKTPRKPRPARPKAAPTVVVTEFGSGLTREDAVDGERARSKFLDPDGCVLGVRVVERDTGRVVVDKGVYGGAKSADAAVAAWLSDNGATGPKP